MNITPSFERKHQLARLSRAIDRYKAVGWKERAEATSKLLDQILNDQMHATWHDEVFFQGDPPSGYFPYHYYSAHAQLASPTLETLAGYYMGCDDLCVISCLFNPCGYHSRVRNFELFIASLSRSTGVHWRSIECAFDNSDFTTPTSDYILHVRSNSVLWQKERLLNRLIASLPDKYEKIAWVDADVMFSNPAWIVEASVALERFPVVQLYSHFTRIDDRPSTDIDRNPLRSFAFGYRKNPDEAIGPTYQHHGHTGLAWAGRREWIDRYGLYDCCLAGSGDHLMAHAFVGDWEPTCLGIGTGPAYSHFVRWCERVYPSIRAKLGFVPGRAIGLWHGAESRRDYYGALMAVRDSGFDPSSDLQLNKDGCWEWSSNKPGLHRWAYEYFLRRREDEY